jgi:hypothetical protein
MTKEVTDIEVEVVEIDGIAPAAPRERSGDPPRRGDWQDWRQWQGKVRRLDGRWWPLWVALGILALFLALTLGLVLGVIFLVFRILMSLLRSILR